MLQSFRDWLASKLIGAKIIRAADGSAQIQGGGGGGPREPA